MSAAPPRLPDTNDDDASIVALTPQRVALVHALVRRVPGERSTTPEQFLAEWSAPDGYQLGLLLLADACRRQDGLAAELALVVVAVFGHGPDHLPYLLAMLGADWHERHEDVVSTIADSRSSSAVDALAGATQWVPGYLAFDDARALATKAIWALGAIRDPAADRALERLARDADPIVAGGAAEQLARRSGTDAGVTDQC